MYVANKNSGSIPISNIVDASNFFAYLEGYPSWGAYVEENLKKSNLQNFIISPAEKDETEIYEKDLDFKTDSLFHKYLINKLTKKENTKKDILINEVRDLDKKIIIGYKFNKITKANDLFFLKKENTLIVGESKIRNSILNQMLENKTSFIHITNEKDNSLLINPIYEIFNSKLINNFFNYDNDISSFQIIWVSLIKNLIEDYNKNINIEFLFESLELSFILNYYNYISEKNINKVLIKKYIESLGIETDNTLSFKIDSNKLIEHKKATKKIKNFLIEIKKGYESGLFSNKNFLIKNILNEKKSIKLYVPNEESEYIYYVYNQILNFNFNEYDNATYSFNKENFGIWIINDNKRILNNNCNFKNIFLIRIFDSLAEVKNINEEQILFSNHKFFNLPNKDFIVYFYINTKYMEKNIFNNAGEELLNMNKEDLFLWQKIDNSFILNKITI